jgi:hypothetical protein
VGRTPERHEIPTPLAEQLRGESRHLRWRAGELQFWVNGSSPEVPGSGFHESAVETVEATTAAARRLAEFAEQLDAMAQTGSAPTPFVERFSGGSVEGRHRLSQRLRVLAIVGLALLAWILLTNAFGGSVAAAVWAAIIVVVPPFGWVVARGRKSRP